MELIQGLGAPRAVTWLGFHFIKDVGESRKGVSLDLGFISGDHEQLLNKLCGCGQGPRMTVMFLGQPLPAASRYAISCQSADFQGYMALCKFGAGCKDPECQAQLTEGLAMATQASQSWDFRVPMWHTCQSSVPAENAHPPLPSWNVLRAAQTPPPPASAASPAPATPTPAWN